MGIFNTMKISFGFFLRFLKELVVECVQGMDICRVFSNFGLQKKLSFDKFLPRKLLNLKDSNLNFKNIFIDFYTDLKSCEQKINFLLIFFKKDYHPFKSTLQDSLLIHHMYFHFSPNIIV
jgi:hypothetical protein